jgi:hypothetical protein
VVWAGTKMRFFSSTVPMRTGENTCGKRVVIRLAV